MKIYILILVTAFLSPAFSQETCGKVDLRPQMGKIRNQRDKGWCFANVAADLLTFAQKVNSHLKEPISSAYMAISYNAVRSQIVPGTGDDIFGNGGVVWQSLNLVQKKGSVCPQSIDNKIIDQGLPTDLSQKLETFRELHTLRHKIRTPEESEKAKQIIADLKASHSILTEHNEEEIEAAISDPDFKQAVLKTADVLCRSSRENLKSTVEFEDYYISAGKSVDGAKMLYTTEPKDLIQELDKALSRSSPVPVGIQYDTKHILLDSEKSELHVSVVVGREIKDNQCQYLIRNSWAENCYNYKYPCEAGHFWVTKDVLRQMTTGVTFQKN